MITSDSCSGLPECAAEFHPDAGWQKCVVHFYRNVFSKVLRPKIREVAAMLKAIRAAEDLGAAQEKARHVAAKLRDQRLTKAAELVEASITETFGYYAFPQKHWHLFRTNNPLEHTARDRPAHAHRWRVPRPAIGAEPGRGAATPCRQHRLVDQGVSLDGSAEGLPTHQHHHLSPGRTPLSQNRMFE